MRLILAAAICLVVGTLWGAASAWQELANDPGLQRFDQEGQLSSGPKILVEGGETFDFGTMDYPYEKPGEHEFVVRNVGTATLTLNPGEPTCRCTISEIRDRSIPAGGQTVIKLTWKPKPIDEQFSNGVDVRTNDPARPSVRFRAVGKVIRAVRCIPDELNLTGVTASEGGHGVIRIYSYTLDDFRIEGHEFLGPQNAELFDIETKPLTAEDIKEKSAKTGVELTVIAKKGLPLGVFDQELKVRTNAEHASEWTIPIHGRVGSDISFIGQKVNADHHIVDFDTLPHGQGGKVTTFLLVKGPARNDVQFKIKSIDPENVLKATLSPPAGAGGQIVRHQLVIEVDPAAPSMVRLGTDVAPYGKIVLETTHPDVPEFVVRVKFAVE